MTLTPSKPFRRLASLRAARRRHTELPPPVHVPRVTEPLPPLEPPDDDREFLPWPCSVLAGPVEPYPRSA